MTFSSHGAASLPSSELLLWAVATGAGAKRISVAEMVTGESAPLVAALSRRDPDGAIIGFSPLSPPEIGALLEETRGMNASLDALLESAMNAQQAVEVALLRAEIPEGNAREEHLRARTTILFDLFNEGTLRGSDPRARQALLDSFSVLPNRYLSPSGGFLLESQEDEKFLRAVPDFDRLTELTEVGGIDKFPSLLAVRGDILKAHGNRVVPSAMIRDGVYVGRRNIFMFHAAVNIAAAIGDDNLVDSHASIGSAAQVGSRNKIGSFVSLEGVLSPANAQGVTIGDDNFLGSFVRIGTGVRLGDRNFIGAGVGLSLGTKLRDCREGAPHYRGYTTPRDLDGEFNDLAVAPNHATREFRGVEVVPGEILVFENTEEFRARFEGDTRIKGTR